MRPRRLIFRVAAICCATIVSSGPLSALDPSKPVSDYGIQIYGADRGLSAFAVTAIMQSSDGFLWLGTDEGLVRFDGMQFTIFNRSNTPELVSDNITSIVEDGSGALWIGTRGAGLFRLKDRRFTRFTAKEGLPGDSVNCLFVDGDGKIWAGIDQGDLCVIENGTLRTVFPTVSSRSLGISSIARTGKATYSASGITVRTHRDGSDTVVTVALPSAVVRSLRIDRSGTLWMGTSRGAFYGDGSNAHRLTAAGLDTSVPVPVIYDDRAGNLWIGTEGMGLIRLAGGRATSLSIREGLSSDRILSICEDREDNLWIGTRGGGLIRLRDNSIEMTSTGDGLTDEFVTTVFESRDGALWVGTRGGGVNEMRDGAVNQGYRAADGLPDDLVRALEEDREGNVWVGTATGLGCLRYNGTGVRRTVVRYGLERGLPPYGVRALKTDRWGVLWVGSYGGGVCRLIDGRLHDADPGGLAFPAPLIRAIAEDSAGTIWVGSQGGLARFAGGVWEKYTADGALAPNVVFTLHAENDGTLWIGTYSRGLFRFRDGLFKAITMKDGLFDDVVYSILDDGIGHFWMSSNKGISRVRKSELNDFADGAVPAVAARSYGVADGMSSSECNGATQPAGWKTRDGKLFFPTVKGLASLDPRALRANPEPPLVRIDLAIADDDTLDLAAAAGLPPGSRRLEIRYTGLNFFAPEKIRFRYTMEGFDEGWIDADTRRSAFYTNLPHGEYLFRVKASNSDGIWTEEGASLAIALPPRLWESWWFRAAGIVSLLASVVAFVRLREKRIKAEELKRHELRAQMLELESRALRAQMNPHFIFNALNAVQERIVSGRTEAACEYLSKFAKLLRMILDHSGKSLVPLDQDLELLRLYVEIESNRFDKGFSYTFDVAPECNGGVSQVPPMLLQPFVENAIWHGLAPKDGERKLTVTASRERDDLLLRVEDNGIGRERSEELKLATGRLHQSKGMGLTHERIEAMNASGTADARLVVTDLRDGQGRSSGTRVELMLRART